MDKEPEITVQQEGAIRWDMFPKATARAYQGVLEELATPNFDRDPHSSQILHDKVVDAIKRSYQSNMESNYEPGPGSVPLSNRNLERYFEDLAEATAYSKKDPDLIPEYELLADIARALARPRRR